MILLIGSFLVLLILNMPVAFALLTSSLLSLAAAGIPAAMSVQRIFTGIDSFTLLAVPFFIMAESIMSALKGSDRFDLALSDDDNQVIRLIVPFCVSSVIVGIVISFSVFHILLGCLVPGILMALAACLGNKLEIIFQNPKVFLYEAACGVSKSALPVLLVLCGIGSGIVTFTESAAFAVAYSLVLCAAYGKLNSQTLFRALRNAGRDIFGIVLIVGVSWIFAWISAMHRAGKTIAENLQAFTSTADTVLLFMSFIFVFAGIFLDKIPVLLVLVPLLFSAAAEGYKLDGPGIVHTSVVFIMAVTAGNLLRPAETNDGVSRKSFAEMLKNMAARGILPFCVLLVVIFAPRVTLLLPKVLSEL
jgi:C4-dicarboxylate transporter DctM subunit